MVYTGGKLVKCNTGKPHLFTSSEHYEEVADAVSQHIYHLMETACNLKRILVPVSYRVVTCLLESLPERACQVVIDGYTDQLVKNTLIVQHHTIAKLLGLRQFLV